LAAGGVSRRIASRIVVPSRTALAIKGATNAAVVANSARSELKIAHFGAIRAFWCDKKTTGKQKNQTLNVTHS
jgi:hypothetical protein